MSIQHARRILKAKKSEEDEEMKESLEQAYIGLQFGNLKKQNAENEKRAADLLEKYNKAKEKEDSDEDEEVAKIEEKCLEEFINSNHTNYAKIEEQYKLFEVVTSDNQS